MHFASVSDFFPFIPNYFSATLGQHGRIELGWGPTARDAALVGVTGGSGAADPGPTDLSSGRLRADGTTYEHFLFNVTIKGFSDFDLFFDRIRLR